MRQKTQSAEDAQFRTALKNMRYAQCTQDDIEFLKTLIAGKKKLDNPTLPKSDLEMSQLLLN